MSRIEATCAAGNDHCVLQQFSFPARRDYQLRSYNTSSNGNYRSLISVGSNAVADVAHAAPSSSPDLLHFQSQQHSAELHDLQESQLPAMFSVNHPGNTSAKNLSFQLTGSLRNVDCLLSSMDKLRSGYSSFHNWQWSDGGSSLPGTPEFGSTVDARSVEDSSKCEMDHHQYPSLNQNPEKVEDERPEAEAEAQEECKLTSDILNSRNCVSAEVLEVSSCYAVQVLERSSTIKGRRWVSGEVERVAPYPCTDGRVQTQGASAARARTGLERASSCNNIRGAYGYNKRRPSASIAWDSLNESPEDSPMRKPVAAVPFKWEEAPGRARRTITAGSDRALARKLSRKKCYPISYFEHVQGTANKRSEQDKVGTRAGAQECGREEAKSSGVRDPDATAIAGAHEARISGASTRDPDRNTGSFRSSRRRYYARMNSGVSDTSTSSFARFSNADQLEIHQAHIDLVAPAAAKFLVDRSNTISPLPTPSKHGLAVPFKWEEAPGKPKKVDHNSAVVAAPEPKTSVAPPVLQLPPRLTATVHKSTFDANAKKAAEIRLSQYINQSMSAPLSVWYHPPPSNDLSAAAVAAVQRRFSPSQCSMSSSESHLRQSGSMEGWIDLLKSPFEPVTRQSLNLQSPTPKRRTLGVTKSGPISTRLHKSLESSDACENSWYHDDHQQQQQHHEHNHHHHNHHHHDVVQDGNLASSPTSILCGPTCENHQRPSPSSILSSVSDVEVQQSATPTVLSVSYSNSQSLSTSQESSERSSSDLASPTSSLRTLLRKCRVKSEWPNSKSKWLSNMGGSDFHQPDLQLSTTTMIPEPWCSPSVDPYFQSLDLTKDAAAASAKTGHQLELPDRHETPVTITSSLVKFNAHDCVSERDVARHGSNLFEHKLGYDQRLQSSKLSYAVLAAVDQEQMVQERCRADNQANFVRCLRIPCSPARFLSRTREVAGNGVDQTLWVDNPSWVSPGSYAEDGYRSPAYTATLELLSPSADLMARRRGSGFRTRSLKFPRPVLNKSLLVESICKSLKHTVLRCAMVCCHRTGPLLRRDEHYVSTNDFQFCKPI